MDTKQAIQDTQNIYSQFLSDWKKLRKIQAIVINQALDKIDECKAEKVLKGIKALM